VAATVERQAHFLLRSVGKAAREYGMLRDGDRVAVAVSGGKDSLALLDLLDRYRHLASVNYDLAAIHVRGDATGVTAAHQPLEDWLAAAGLPYRSVEPEPNAGDEAPLECQRCTWLRRKALFFAADELACNVLAYAHHADDVVRSFTRPKASSPVSLAPVAFRLRRRLARAAAIRGGRRCKRCCACWGRTTAARCARICCVQVWIIPG
jgi:hypothetical protein